ncbi:NlpC/P60 family protein [Eubacteriales bacterium OttesenSCG-928-N13]|nr:NlpC/P60 family protein [Eubacteriales bacterium OttesenSCG-928-N13]
MTAAEKRKEIVRLYLSRKGKNNYTQGANRGYFFGKPEGKNPGYSDCSSSVRAVYLKLLNIDIGGNTEAQVLSKKGVVVDRTDGLYPNEANLKLGDTLYFKGNSGHAEGVGHVEIYTAKGQCAGHGSGTGPNIHTLRSYCQQRGKARRYYKAIRWIADDPADKPATGAKIEVTGATVNVRAGAGTNQKILGVVKKGTLLPCMGTDASGWFAVDYKGAQAYISEKYSRKVG